MRPHRPHSDERAKRVDCRDPSPAAKPLSPGVASTLSYARDKSARRPAAPRATVAAMRFMGRYANAVGALTSTDVGAIAPSRVTPK